jgi:hypothetical protein
MEIGKRCNSSREYAAWAGRPADIFSASTTWASLASPATARFEGREWFSQADLPTMPRNVSAGCERKKGSNRLGSSFWPLRPVAKKTMV